MITINKNSAIYLMLKRQNLIERNDDVDYEKLFRMMSPVPTLHWTTPGEPPLIQYRFDIDDKTLNNYNRANRNIIKGRFRGGNVGYIYQDELPLFMAAYKKEIGRMTEIDEIVLQTIKQEGAMSTGMIKEITGFLSKQVSAALQKLQKAFILYEDQTDSESDRIFYILEEEFYDMEFDKYSRSEAIEEVILRFAYLNVFIDGKMIKSFTRFSNKDINAAICSLLEKGKIIEVSKGDGNGYILKQDLDEIKKCTQDIVDDIYIMDLNDYIVKSNEIKLKERFPRRKPCLILHYIFKKGEFIGALLGHFRFGPNDLEDVILDIKDTDKIKYKKRILNAIKKTYNPKETKLKRYCGEIISY